MRSFLVLALLLLTGPYALAQSRRDNPWCDELGLRPPLESPAGSPHKYKHMFDKWVDPVDEAGNPIAPEDYYIGACAPIRQAKKLVPNGPTNAEVLP
jgi:hypothetical protein